MSLDLPSLARFLRQPLKAVEVALPKSLNGKWPWPSRVRTNFAALRTDEGTLLYHYGLVPDGFLNGLEEDNPFEGYMTQGTLAILAAGDAAAEREALEMPAPWQSPEPLEMVPLDRLFPNAGPIYVPGATAVELSYTQIIRDGAFRFDVSGIRIYSSEGSASIARGSGGVLECRL